MTLIEITIDRLGAGGDGVGTAGERTLYVPFTAPGDRVRVELGAARGGGLEARVVERLADGPGRIAPACPHFGVCGGCAVQHVAADRVGAWKCHTIAQALAARGLHDVAVTAPEAARPGTRRRLRLAIARQGGRVALGFLPRFGKAVVDIGACPVATRPLVALLPRLRAVLGGLRGWRTGQAIATDTAAGIDLVLDVAIAVDAQVLGRLAAFADETDLARLTLLRDGVAEPVVTRRMPQVFPGGIAVDLPPGGFLQPTADGEAAIGAVIVAAAAGRKRIADLYAGLGTWTFRLGGAVHAVEGDAALADALRNAAARAGLAGRVTAEVRDLARRSLGADALKRFDAVVIDPPRAGAREQVAELARAAMPLVVMVSCNPATFARDARSLLDGGYRLGAVTAVDQFLWSPHVELVAAFAR